MRIKYLIILLIPIFIILFSFRLYVFNTDFYKNEFQDNNVYSNVPEADEYAKNIISYIKDESELSKDFSERATLHMKDVKHLINTAIFILYISTAILIFSIAYLIKNKKYKRLTSSLTYGGILSLALLTIFIFLIYLSFNKTFINFHLIFFTNDLWMLSKGDLLLKLFPQEFFMNIAKRIALTAIMTSTIITFTGIILRYKKRF
jgi:integral membrane protein (TIGR01906 family)